MELTDSQKEILLNQKKDKENTSFKKIKTYAKCVDIYDGDTCKIKFFYRNEITQCAVRLLGIDTPEIKPHHNSRTDDSIKREKELAIKAKELLIKLMGDNLIFVVFEKDDKYGRPLVTIYRDKTETKSINQQILESGLANLYDGGHKQEFKKIE
jgi:endonuclease YncB( thermonuclease family)